VRKTEPTEAELAAKQAAQTARVFRQQVIGLAVLGLAVVGVSLWRSGWHIVFGAGWWRW
jgi:hypothetical protein